jgi:hypothetical protein
MGVKRKKHVEGIMILPGNVADYTLREAGKS